MRVSKINHPIYKRKDGSYVLMHTNGYPYSVANDGTSLYPYDEVEAYLAAHPEALVPEPVPPPPTPEELAAQRKNEIMARFNQIALSSDRSGRAVALNRATEEDIQFLTALDDEAEALRVELRALQF